MGISVGEQQDRQRALRELARIANALERIAAAQERISPPPPKEDQ